jgi:hypothetical protein
MGKSSVLRNLTNYVADRELFEDGIIYLDLEKTDSVYEIKD